uniref:Uncharacterized protein n=1 Tax=Timema bartmani TaxID=61472 RepID=A0A7R9I2J6_9NEOP|nr:unnamed protein product [Timema bartmani]
MLRNTPLDEPGSIPGRGDIDIYHPYRGFSFLRGLSVILLATDDPGSIPTVYGFICKVVGMERGQLSLEGCLPLAPRATLDGATLEGTTLLSSETDWLEQTVVAGFRVWHIIFLSLASLLTLVVLLCCCFRFRIPRTKQEIEADYVRKKISKKFQKQLRAIPNTEMDDADLKRALDRVRAEIKSDTESVAQSEGMSAGSLSSGRGHPSPEGPQETTYRKASDIHIGISTEDLQPPKGVGARFNSVVESTWTKLRTKKQ